MVKMVTFMVKMANFMLGIFYHNEQKKKKKDCIVQPLNLYKNLDQ